MSDDLDFDFDLEGDSQGQQVESPEAATETPPATPTGPSPEDYATMQRRLESAEKWQQDFMRLAGQMGGNGQQQQQEADRLTKFIQDPEGYEQELLSKAQNMAVERVREEQAISKIEAEFPELVPFKNLFDWGEVMQTTTPQFMQKNGRKPTFEEALRDSATYLKQTLFGNTANQQAGQREVMRLNVGGSQPPTGQTDPSSMSDADFGQFLRANGF